MKVIFLKDVPGVAAKGAVKDVSDGYALNFLFPGRYAEPATKTALNELAKKKVEKEKLTEDTDKKWADLTRRLQGVTITVAARANDIGHLYTQLPLNLITQKIKEEFSIDIPTTALVLNAPIKAVGDTSVEVRLGNYSATFTVTVIKTAP